ncbi:MAG: acyltransferase family protein [Bacilli bacterium]|nr:acyltransferase family protein [Bacilli bacterium]
MKKIFYLDVLRIIACFLVIVNHTVGCILDYEGFINTTFYCVSFSLCKIGVPLFLMITGVLILDKDYDYKKIFKSIFKIFVPLLIISISFYIRDVGLKGFDFIDFIKLFLSKPYIVSYWYLLALIGLYITVPFIQKLIKDFKNKDYIYFIVLFLLLPSTLSLISKYLNVNFSSYFLWSFFPIFMCIPICGNYISKIELKKIYFIISLFVIIISYAGMFLSLYIPFLQGNAISYKLDGYNTLPVLLMAISLFYIIRYTLEKKSISQFVEKLIFTVASTTFGIYLIHTMLHYKLYTYIFKKIFMFNGIIGVILLEIGVFIVCSIIIYILKKIPIIKKYL